MKAELEKHYDITTRVLGPDEGDSQQARVLNRILTWGPEGISYEADPRHTEIATTELGPKEAKGVVAPGTKEDGTTKEDKDHTLDEDSAIKYRGSVSRLNYLTSDRPNIAFSAKEPTRTMSSLSTGCQDKLRRLGGIQSQSREASPNTCRKTHRTKSAYIPMQTWLGARKPRNPRPAGL